MSREGHIVSTWFRCNVRKMYGALNLPLWILLLKKKKKTAINQESGIMTSFATNLQAFSLEISSCCPNQVVIKQIKAR